MFVHLSIIDLKLNVTTNYGYIEITQSGIEYLEMSLTQFITSVQVAH